MFAIDQTMVSVLMMSDGTSTWNKVIASSPGHDGLEDSVLIGVKMII